MTQVAEVKTLVERVGRNDDGSLDEIVARGLVHLEQMDDDHWTLVVSDDGDEALLISFWSNAAIRVSVVEPAKYACSERAEANPARTIERLRDALDRSVYVGGEDDIVLLTRADARAILDQLAATP